MKIVNTGNIYSIYPDDLKTYDVLPAAVYTAQFSKMSGFFLESYPEVEVTEKIYGPHESKVAKVLKGFKASERNFGVILSGDKGIGKSICAKLIAQRAVESGYPVILINSAISGLSGFINSISQEIVVIFDEFDKVFRKNEDGDPQTELLTLFDGFSTGKKLFVVTCNELRGLNDYIVNRPGRFHYHLRFDYPTPDEIEDYLTDKLDPAYAKEITKVISFASRVNLNYDCLRAISTELNTGEQFEEAIKDLNIMHLTNESYDGVVFFNDGGSTKTGSMSLDLFSSNEESWWIMYNKQSVRVAWNNDDVTYDPGLGCSIIPGDAVSLSFDEDDFPTDDKGNTYNPLANLKVEYIRLKRKPSATYHYMI